jgi:hypothetical protein
MKTIIILFISLIALSLGVSGQDYNLKYIDSEIKRNSSPPGIQTKNTFKDSKFLIKRSPGYPILRDTGRSLLNPKESFHYYSKVRRYHNFQIAEVFPGASRYYAKNRSLINSPYSAYFIVKPDTASKYYLIIKDPEKPNE